MRSRAPATISGDLKVDSPALLGALKKRFSLPEIEKISALYRLVSEHGASLEIGIERPAGASFNPRVARICQLLVHEGQSETLLSVQGAMLAALPSLDQAPFDLPEAAGLAALSKDPEVATTDTEALKIALCVCIDTIRHLHMSKDLESRDAALEFAARLIAAGKISVQSKRLWQLLHGAITQQQLIADAE